MSDENEVPPQDKVEKTYSGKTPPPSGDHGRYVPAPIWVWVIIWGGIATGLWLIGKMAIDFAMK